MCGIVGLFLKNAALEPKLGALLTAMLDVMSDRGPDSAGFALYNESDPSRVKLTVRLTDQLPDIAELIGEIETAFALPAEIVVRDTHAVLSIPAAAEPEIRKWIEETRPEIRVVGVGRRMELYKEVGRPESVARRFGLAAMSGTHAIGHTRMATESSVTTDGAHPFSTGLDQCLVHNGSLSNHNDVRRKLRHEGLAFETDNDSEVAAGYLTWRMSEGASLKQALEASLKDLDGFYTF
ncbi:MAG TPA: hypothetical protein VNH44_04120, partial [Micropepsaceae bacterium]|nr:hypothetical protein [Micropepsaceae bacterium]